MRRAAAHELDRRARTWAIERAASRVAREEGRTPEVRVTCAVARPARANALAEAGAVAKVARAAPTLCAAATHAAAVRAPAERADEAEPVRVRARTSAGAQAVQSGLSV